MKLKNALNTAASLIAKADSIIIGAGAGMGVDSGLPDFRGKEGFWRAYPALAQTRIDFTEIANPAAFQHNPKQAWGFYGHRLNLYRQTKPHQGYDILRRWGKRKSQGYSVFTSNVDGHFQKAGFAPEKVYECHGSIHFLQCSVPCQPTIFSAHDLSPLTDDEQCLLLSDLPRCKHCGAVLRPNILMFGDAHWLEARSQQQAMQMQHSIKQMHSPVVIELGAGCAVPTVRYFCESLGAPLIRINPREPELNGGKGVSLAMGAHEALKSLDSLL